MRNGDKKDEEVDGRVKKKRNRVKRAEGKEMMGRLL